MTADELFPVVLRGRVALCITCKQVTTAPVAVREIHSTSGPGTTLYACPEHAESVAPGPMPGELHWP
ncbi:hypothetical protein [Streptomyces sp. DSM 41634]|uniref:hypothetical protein n=1 Tax=Streptomyces sp. DSM 41634 TaxID=3448656 RepID=UPI0028881371|nr:hypothetical protein [Streptomyces sp. DSM 41633]